MHNLSDIASAAPKAQQDPQLAWSLISLIEEQFGHWVLESKEAGALTDFNNRSEERRVGKEC